VSLKIGLLMLALLVPASLANASEWSEDDSARWTAILDEARETLLAARSRVTKADYAYQDWRQRHWPRGAKKGEMLTEIDEAKAALADAEVLWPETLEKARKAGAPPGLLRRYDTPASPD